jgi:hypothetical protein
VSNHYFDWLRQADADLCLILRSSDKLWRDRAEDFLPVGFPVGVDLLPRTRDEFDRLADHSPGWSRAILSGREG